MMMIMMMNVTPNAPLKKQFKKTELVVTAMTDSVVFSPVQVCSVVFSPVQVYSK